MSDARDPVKLPKFIPQFDGLRAFAVVAVMLYHAAPHFPALHINGVAQFGWAGVDLFFVLSGFLITGILVEAKGSPTYFRSFYMRRALRIWPLYFIFLAAIFLFAPIVQPELRELYKTFHWYYYALYIQNLTFKGEFPFSITWSLAVEEQFYMLWPLAVWFFSPRTLRNLLISIVVLSPLARLLAFWGGMNWYGLYYHTPFRLHGLAIGALAALWVRSRSCDVKRWNAAGWICVAVGAPLSIWLLVTGGKDSQHSIMVYSWLSILFGGVMALSVNASAAPSWAASALRWRPIGYVGKISYGLYLLHLPVFGFFFAVLARTNLMSGWSPIIRDGVTLSALLLITIGAASISWFAMEQPILKLKGKFSYRAGQRPAPAEARQAPLAAAAIAATSDSLNQ